MDDKIKNTEKMSENEEITAEDLEDVSGGVIEPVKPIQCLAKAYGFIEHKSLRSLTPEEWKKIKEKMEEERKKRESEEKMNQVSALGAGESSSTQ